MGEIKTLKESITVVIFCKVCGLVQKVFCNAIIIKANRLPARDEKKI